MCGIVGYVGNKDAVGIILSGLKRLEYRGYDSGGIAVIRAGAIVSAKCVGKLAALEEELHENSLAGSSLGIGHTRWATHGVPNEANAHPHFDGDHRIAVVHNGIIENYAALREDLKAKGVEFRSDTDSETLAHLVAQYYDGDLMQAVRRTLQKVVGAYAIGVVALDQPDMLVAARKGSPLVIGLGEGEKFIASDVPAIMNYTRQVIYLEDGQLCALRRDGYSIEDLQQRDIDLPVKEVDWDHDAAEKQGYPHFMLKEIHEQPEVISNTLRGRISDENDSILLEEMNISPEAIRKCSKIHIVACGTAWHAGLVGKYLIERFARIPVETDIASEYRYRDPIVTPETIMIPVSQSGETADTLEAIRIAKRKGAQIASIVNVVGSSVAREADGVIYQHAGPEIGVASTKAYTSQIAAFALLAMHFAEVRGTLAPDQLRERIAHLREMPDLIGRAIARADDIAQLAAMPKYLHALGAFYIGRGYNFPSALEGALKLKEISYMHAEGYGAGEMKHGPIALVTDKLPVISIATRSETYDKVCSNIQEIRAREGIVLSIATEGDDDVFQFSDDVIHVPDCYEPFSPMVAAIPLQLFAYHIAVNRGCDVDKPRNLAKSVTVE
jgi:glucosamine--fructose-6-phosphate aminotransferase (isomerizing)